MKAEAPPQPFPSIPQRRSSLEDLPENNLPSATGLLNPRPPKQPERRRSDHAASSTVSDNFTSYESNQSGDQVTIDTYGADTLRSPEIHENPKDLNPTVDPPSAYMEEDNSTIATKSMTVPFKTQPPNKTPLQVIEDVSETSSNTTKNPNKTTGSVKSASTVLTEDSIRAHLVDLYDDFSEILITECSHQRDAWTCFFEKYYKPGFCWMRASGNPIYKDGLVDLLVDDIQGISFALVSVDQVQILAQGRVAVATITFPSFWNGWTEI